MRKDGKYATSAAL